MSDRQERHARVVERAAKMRDEDPTLPAAPAETLAARELFPRKRRPLPQHPKRLRTSEEQAAIQAEFTKRFGKKP